MKESKEKEYEDTIASHGDLITKICYYFSSDPEEFKDIRQEILINLWKGWDKFQGESKISTWIYRVCFNTCVSYQRKEKKHSHNISIEEAIGLASPAEPDIAEKYKIMHSLIRKLSYEDRAIILMWLDEKSYDEIASLMGMNRNTIAVKLMRIKEKLKNLSADYR